MERSRVLALGLALTLLASAAACANLIGLDKFVDCNDPQNASQCDAGADALPGDATVTDAADAAQDSGDAGDADADIDTGPPLPDGSVRSDWAQSRIPHYDGGLLDAALIQDAQARPSITQGGVFQPDMLVTADPLRDGGKVANDRVSSLLWLVHSEHSYPSTFTEAQTACATKGARVPTRIEALMLLDPAMTRDADGGPYMMRREVFANGVALYDRPQFWTSTLVARSVVSFWIVDFATGKVFPSESGKTYGFLCVR